MIITKHGYKRATQRAGLPRNKVANAAHDAFTRGADLHKTSEAVRRWVFLHCDVTGKGVRLYKGRLWFFDGRVFITCIDVPQNIEQEHRAYTAAQARIKFEASKRKEWRRQFGELIRNMNRKRLKNRVFWERVADVFTHI